MALIRLHPPRDGLAPLAPMDPAMLERGNPQMVGRTWFADPANRYKCVAWGATPYRIRPKQRPDHEFGFVLEGGFTLTHDGGRDTEVRAGDAYVLPARVTYQWGQTGPVLKNAVSVVLPEAAGADAFEVWRAAELETRAGQLYRDPSGHMTLTLLALAAGEGAELPAGAHLMLVLVSGAVTVSAGGQDLALEGPQRLHVEAGAAPAVAATSPARLLVCATTIA